MGFSAGECVEFGAAVFEDGDALAHGVDERQVHAHGEQRRGFARLDDASPTGR